LTTDKTLKSYIHKIGTSVPVHRFSQNQIAGFMVNVQEMNAIEERKLEVLYRASGIRYRNSVLRDFGEDPDKIDFLGKNGMDHPSVSDRMKLFKKEALPLAIKAVNNCLGQKYKPHEFTHLITVSCTGMYAPGLDIDLIEELDLPSHIKRTGIHFMGCYAAFNALKAADSFCKSDREALVLIVCVELCTIHFQNRKDDETLLSNALFSDGAAAVVVGPNPRNGSVEMMSFYSDIDPSGKQDMTWEISDFGFEIRLSSYIPDLIKNGIYDLTQKLLMQLEISLEQIDHFAIHPGGKKILKVIEESLKIHPEKSQYAHKVLSENGNMSSPTIFFVLEEILNNLNPKKSTNHILSFAFGPGLTLESMLLRTMETH